MSENARLREKVRGGLRTLYDKLGKRLCNGLIFGPLLLLCAKCGAPRSPVLAHAQLRFLYLLYCVTHVLYILGVSVLYCVTHVLYLLAGNSGGDVMEALLRIRIRIRIDYVLKEIDQN
jgi:hypothetical protein